MQCREESSIIEDDDCVLHWEENSQTPEHIRAILLEKTKEAALKRERALSYAFSHQVLLQYLFLLFFNQLLLKLTSSINGVWF